MEIVKSENHHISSHFSMGIMESENDYISSHFSMGNCVSFLFLSISFEEQFVRRFLKNSKVSGSVCSLFFEDHQNRKKMQFLKSSNYEIS